MKNKKTPLKDCPLEQKKLPQAYSHPLWVTGPREVVFSTACPSPTAADCREPELFSWRSWASWFCQYLALIEHLFRRRYSVQSVPPAREFKLRVTPTT